MILNYLTPKKKINCNRCVLFKRHNFERLKYIEKNTHIHTHNDQSVTVKFSKHTKTPVFDMIIMHHIGNFNFRKVV